MSDHFYCSVLAFSCKLDVTFFFFLLTEKERHTNQDEEINRVTVNLTVKGAKEPQGPFPAEAFKETLKHCHKLPYIESLDS